MGKIHLNSPDPESGLVTVNAPGRMGLVCLGTWNRIGSTSSRPLRKQTPTGKCYWYNYTHLLWPGSLFTSPLGLRRVGDSKKAPSSVHLGKAHSFYREKNLLLKSTSNIRKAVPNQCFSQCLAHKPIVFDCKTLPILLEVIKKYSKIILLYLNLKLWWNLYCLYKYKNTSNNIAHI